MNNGNPERKSKFICIHCLQENHVGDGIQRKPGECREKYHIKHLVCLCTGLQRRTVNMEVRYCDNFDEIMDKVIKVRDQYYNDYIEIKEIKNKP